jgi:hypothetical protein
MPIAVCVRVGAAAAGLARDTTARRPQLLLLLAENTAAYRGADTMWLPVLLSP